MKGLGSGDSGEFTFLDCISLLSFYIAIQNLDSNLTQDDKQELQNQISRQTNNLLDEVHSHLTNQDLKIDKILSILEERENGSTRNI